MRSSDAPLFLFLGLIWGIAITTIIMVIFAFPTAHDGQFKRDCEKMAHGTMSNHECVKGNTILFHEH